MLSANACVKSFETRRPWLLVPRSQCRSAVCTCHAAGSVCHQSPSRAHAPFASWHHAASCQAGETRYYGRRVELWGGLCPPLPPVPNRWMSLHREVVVRREKTFLWTGAYLREIVQILPLPFRLLPQRQPQRLRYPKRRKHESSCCCADFVFFFCFTAAGPK